MSNSQHKMNDLTNFIQSVKDSRDVKQFSFLHILLAQMSEKSEGIVQEIYNEQAPQERKVRDAEDALRAANERIAYLQRQIDAHRPSGDDKWCERKAIRFLAEAKGGLNEAAWIGVIEDKKINAIKEYRTQTGCGLAEAKAVIEAYVAYNPKIKDGDALRDLESNKPLTSVLKHFGLAVPFPEAHCQNSKRGVECRDLRHYSNKVNCESCAPVI